MSDPLRAFRGHKVLITLIISPSQSKIAEIKHAHINVTDLPEIKMPLVLC